LVPSLNDVVRHHTDLAEEDLDWLHFLIADWQIIADLSFADLVLWLPDRGGHGFWAGAQMRPTTGPTAHVDDLVGAYVRRGQRPLLDSAHDEGRIAREGDPEWRDDVPVRVEAIPVRRGDSVLGVIARNTNLLGVRTPSRLELAYLQTATDLARMISEGSFPYTKQRQDLSASPRVGDGFVRLDDIGLVTYASPNAQSAYRRLGLSGDLVGQHLGEITAALVGPATKAVDESLAAAVSGRGHREIEIENAEGTVILRSIPLRLGGEHIGGLALIRDVTELRRRERELLTKDATIREIHHRVKNNLQTVAALLRLQARRMTTPAARAALEEAERRVGSIAIVHETLSQTFDEQVDFDEVADRLRKMVVEVSSTRRVVLTERKGSFATLSAEVATPLAMALTEVVQNAVQHGFAGRGGTVTVSAEREADRLRMGVDDDGGGLTDGFNPVESDALGLSIVRTLFESELGGTLELGAAPTGGTRVIIEFPVSSARG
jgi:two-component sensor histidine kinase